MKINDKVKTIRRMVGFSQEPIAKNLGISVQAYSKKESGQTRITTDDIQKIAKCLGVSPTIFFEDEFNVEFNKIKKIKSDKQEVI